MMTAIKKFMLYSIGGFLGLILVLIVGFNIWGALTQGTLNPDINQPRDGAANKVVMVFGATGSAGGGLLKAAIEDSDVKTIYVITRRVTPFIKTAVDSNTDGSAETGKVTVIMQKDFTDYSKLSRELSETSTVLWGLGVSSLEVDEPTYTMIHVDFPAAFMSSWLTARKAAGKIASPMAFHFIAGMGTEDSDAPWAHDKRKTERDMAAMAEGTGLRSFSYRSAYIRPISETTNTMHHITEALMRPGSMVITAKELGQAMLEISARTQDLANGTLLDNGESLAYVKLYAQTKR